ncbi:MAG: adenosylcobalamin-dependent ribonucleoside-diphosphate reductase [Magnetococcales bacterium]|nr:adenosylcobalamin-dependent ribonucleoside-diphosphate reductase [Magnetococcales bacterium]NGZ04985.1 adenosylcobalamin-dependent ribonucleoside-diphosphate reductase [Magnetococcales bacterium]
MKNMESSKEPNEIKLQPAAMAIWDSKYRLKSAVGVPVDQNLEDTWRRVALTLASVEKPEIRSYWEQEFLNALRQGAIPGGRIISNAGAGAHKPATSTINCTVSGTVGDSMVEILDMVREAGLTLKAGCGIGYEFSTLRPRGAYVAGAGSSTSGPLSFMDIFDSMCKTVSSAGGRRGAQMATFDISHPDVLDFIRAKREDGRLRQFNLSCLITTPFIEAVKGNADWDLVFPANPSELQDPNVQIVYRHWPVTTPPYRLNAQGEVACRVYRRLPARRLWDLIMSSTYDYAEPGFILIDKVNEMNNNWFCEEIRATNPCGEQPLPPHGACLLGSINLTCFVQRPFTREADFDWPRFRSVVRVFTRMLDNVVEIHGLPLAPQAAEIARKRRHGMGFMGLGSAIIMLNMTYGDAASVRFTEQVAREMAIVGWETGVELAQEKGSAPLLEELFTIDEILLARRPRLREDGFRLGDQVPGRVLLANYSHYLARFPAELRQRIADLGCRFTHHTSIAPTGTIALSLGNNCSNGIEPSFSHKYSRNVIVAGRKTKEKVDVLSYELLVYRALINPLADPFAEDERARLPANFMDASAIAPEQHVEIQAAAQKWIDSSISKTINVPTDFPFDRFKEIYLQAYDSGLKGCTTFRFNPEAFQGVLVKNQDLANTTYRFTLENGETVELRGDEQVEYDGEIHTAANLYDALKEGYYGKL